MASIICSHAPRACTAQVLMHQALCFEGVMHQGIRFCCHALGYTLDVAGHGLRTNLRMTENAPLCMKERAPFNCLYCLLMVCIKRSSLRFWHTCEGNLLDQCGQGNHEAWPLKLWRAAEFACTQETRKKLC